MEIKLIQYLVKGKATPHTGVVVLVCSSEPESGQKYACINVTCGKVPYAALITDDDDYHSEADGHTTMASIHMFQSAATDHPKPLATESYRSLMHDTNQKCKNLSIVS